ncbi:MAG: hypothetical protein O3A00_23415 [Planctomycetota bacterium]|nr:hypothetical protein [Planctomycetota bacterium]
MKNLISDALDGLIGGRELTNEDIALVLLLCGMLLSMSYLFTMLLTRWGDRNATFKSLIFSVIVHGVIMTVFVTYRLPILADFANRKPDPPPDDERIQVRKILMEGDEDVPLEDGGNSSVLNPLPEPPKQQLSRVDRTTLDNEPPATPERQRQIAQRPDHMLPDMLPIPKDTADPPTPENSAEIGPRAEATPAIATEADTPKPVVEPPTPSVPLQRLIRPRPELEAGEVAKRQPRGNVDRLAPELDPTNQLALNSLSPNPTLPFKPVTESELDRLRVGPRPSNKPIPETGESDDPEPTPSIDGAGGRGRVTSRLRSPQRTARPGRVEPFRTQRTPRSADPDPGPQVAVRDGLLVRSPTRLVSPNPPISTGSPLEAPRRITASIPLTYQLRNIQRRKDVAIKYGGTEASERAVEASLSWLAAQQETTGYWDADRHGAGQVKFDESGVNRRNAGIKADTGVTALALLCFLGAGNTHESGPFSENVDRAIRWLVAQQGEDGNLAGEATHYAQMYCHGMATYALAEALGMHSEPLSESALRVAVRRGVKYIADNQNARDGGWRYIKDQQSDMSMFGWQLMGLKSAEIAGIPIATDVRKKLFEFLNERSLGNQKGLAGYRADEPPTPTMTAEALFCKQMLGIEREHPASLQAVEYLRLRVPRQSSLNIYYWYYGTLAMFQYGGEPWKEWNESLRDLLVADQRKDGIHAGSWDPKGPWGRYGGRLYSTTLSTLSLEVYYRFLPLYKMGGRYQE